MEEKARRFRLPLERGADLVVVARRFSPSRASPRVCVCLSLFYLSRSTATDSSVALSSSFCSRAIGASALPPLLLPLEPVLTLSLSLLSPRTAQILLERLSTCARCVTLSPSRASLLSSSPPALQSFRLFSNLLPRPLGGNGYHFGTAARAESEREAAATRAVPV